MAGLLLLSVAGITSCSDDDNEGGMGEDGRMFMTQFRTIYTTQRPSSDPTLCHSSENTIKLFWNGVKGCAGYQVRMSIAAVVSTGTEAWETAAAAGRLMKDTIIPDPDCLHLEIPDLQYSLPFRFAIRALSPDGVEAHHSKWYGYGNGQQWADWTEVSTADRFEPEVLTPGEITKNSIRVNLVPEVSLSIENPATDQDDAERRYEIQDGKFVFDKIKLTASATNPDAVVPDEFKDYTVTAEDFARGYIDITGLSANSAYSINVENSKFSRVGYEGYWNKILYTCALPRTAGEPGEPILIPWSCNPNDVSVDGDGVATVIPGVADYQACKLDTVIMNFNKDTKLAEGQVFYLEGGKNYYTYMNVELCKGFTLATNPDDLAAGKGRAHVFLGGIHRGTDGVCTASNNFMFGRQPQDGEGGAIYVQSIIFRDIDFDCPTADSFNGKNATGNYFANMYSNGMAVTFKSFEAYNCSFQHMIRGFIRVQGTKVKKFEKVVLDNCEMFNSGYYADKGGYQWVAGDGKSPRSNIYNDFRVTNSTIYDSPRGTFFTDNNKDLAWAPSIKYNITFDNNTIVNFSTRVRGQQIFSFKYLPSGSTIRCHKNLFVMARSADDTGRFYFAEGSLVKIINGDPQEITLDFADNYCTNVGKNWTTITNGDDYWTSSAFSSKDMKAFYRGDDASELSLKLGNDGGLSPQELFIAPNPPHKKNNTKHDHTVGATSGISNGETDVQTGAQLYSGNLEGLNGSKVNLYYQNTPKVLASEIYQKQIGAPKWREGIGRGAAARRAARRR